MNCLRSIPYSIVWDVLVSWTLTRLSLALSPSRFIFQIQLSLLMRASRTWSKIIIFNLLELSQQIFESGAEKKYKFSCLFSTIQKRHAPFTILHSHHLRYRLRQFHLIWFTWMQCVSAWVVPVSKLLFKHERWNKLVIFMITYPSCVPS